MMHSREPLSAVFVGMAWWSLLACQEPAIAFKHAGFVTNLEQVLAKMFCVPPLCGVVDAFHKDL